jgi:2-polyprenyl-3-methyl-5-hydroxy-6-metoxy-1,4-benzoquinol methylase
VATKYRVIHVEECAACGLYFTNPIYRSIVGEQFYDRLYSAEGLTTHTPGAPALETLKRSGFAGTDKDASGRLAFLATLTTGRRLLEVGSSWGYFLFQAERAGWTATGIEVAERRRTAGNRELGVDIVSSFQEVHARGGTFDVVYTSHTLEHFTDLSTVFGEMRRSLPDGGLLVIEVPECDIRRDGSSVLSRMGAVHPLGFSSAFFDRVLPREGFLVRSIHGGSGQLVVVAEKHP